MRRSGRQILTTHAGSLPFPGDAPPAGEPQLTEAVGEVVARQRKLGLDLVNEGEYTKGGDWLSFADDRFAGFVVQPPSDDPPLVARGEDRAQFADFYRYATEQNRLFYMPSGRLAPRRMRWVCTGPIAYRGHAAVLREIELLQAAGPGEDAFLTSTAPASLEVYRDNVHYATEEEYLYALAEALREEYELIAAAGLVLQVDDAWLPALWDRIGIEMGLEKFRERCRVRVEALNHALRNVPEDRVRYHMCWGSWHGPHAFDLELAHLVDILLGVRAQAYLIEGANARHEHEWEVWRDVALPEDKILIPGVVTHATDVVEHPRLVAQRIRRYADAVGAENLIAGTDCGFGGRSHPQIAWAKLAALVEGARLASANAG
ncbi:MAG TPA: cobalamin-independent methionine synthase II family protein [Solirubrobacteraceae bacterium]|jgi:5-methyltetrahydropteroyltriglutamate--homocysteine methyltransferase|nr:cobalamin-independent methionine synthase II family protein [Solirubrobacteraceae bacterium]